MDPIDVVAIDPPVRDLNGNATLLQGNYFESMRPIERDRPIQAQVHVPPRKPAGTCMLIILLPGSLQYPA